LIFKGRQKYNKRLILILAAIGVSTIILILILNRIIPSGPDNDIPNWMTMTAEIGVGFFIAVLVYLLQGKTSNSLLDLIRKIESYNEEQKSLLRSVRLSSLDRIEDYRSMATNVIEYDKGKVTDLDKPRQGEAVESFMSRSIIERLQILYGLSGSFPAIWTPTKKVENWLNVCDLASPQIERTKELIREIRTADDTKAYSS
jgi:hypothetical protein